MQIPSFLQKIYNPKSRNNRMEEKKENKIDFEELAKKYNVDLKELEAEQKKLAKGISLKDAIDFSLADRIAGIETTFFQNKIISAIVVLNSQMEVIEQQYASDIIRFPYIPGFRAYRELPCIIQAFNKLDETPESKTNSIDPI